MDGGLVTPSSSSSSSAPSSSSSTAVDRIRELPEVIRLHILTLLPFKSAVTTGILSSEWRGLWKRRWLDRSSFDFVADSGDRRDLIVSNVNSHIELHPLPRRLDALRIAFLPRFIDLRDVRRWMKYADACGVADVHLNLWPSIESHEPPKFIFNYGISSLVRLSLTGCHLWRRPSNKNLSSLEVVRLHRVSIDPDAMKNLMASCSALRVLDLHFCLKLQNISGCNLSLTTLTVVDCPTISYVVIEAPRLRSLRLCNVPLEKVWIAGDALEDVYMSCPPLAMHQPWFWAYSNASRFLAPVQVLTLGGHPLQELDYISACGIPKIMENLRELQLMLATMPDGRLGSVYCLFEHCRCPSLEKLFIELPSTSSDDDDDMLIFLATKEEEPPFLGVFSFESLRTIKMNYFNGNSNKRMLVKFFLEKAIHLESMILVATSVVRGDADDPKCDPTDELSVLHDQLELLPKASIDATLLLCESDVDGVHPTHRKFHGEI